MAFLRDGPPRYIDCAHGYPGSHHRAASMPQSFAVLTKVGLLRSNCGVAPDEDRIYNETRDNVMELGRPPHSTMLHCAERWSQNLGQAWESLVSCRSERVTGKIGLSLWEPTLPIAGLTSLLSAGPLDMLMVPTRLGRARELGYWRDLVDEVRRYSPGVTVVAMSPFSGGQALQASENLLQAFGVNSSIEACLLFSILSVRPDAVLIRTSQPGHLQEVDKLVDRIAHASYQDSKAVAAMTSIALS